MPHIRVENHNFQMGGRILFWVDEILLFFQFRVEISTQDTKKAAMTFSVITALIERSQGESNPQLALRRRLLYPFN